MEKNMNVRLICFSQPTAEFFKETGMGTMEELTAYFARVSNPSNQMNTQTSRKLIKYLINNKHWSPLEMTHATLEINTTRDIARQILRHRSFSFQEFSQRYADPTQMEFEVREARLQDEFNRQNSIDIDRTDPEQRELAEMFRMEQMTLLRNTKKLYKWALSNGIAKEQARAILPEGLTPSRMYMAGSLRSWVHYIQLRSENGTQLEHMDIAKECAKVLEPVFPLIKDLVGD
jgi:thymidylate synthase (FAD)